MLEHVRSQIRYWDVPQSQKTLIIRLVGPNCLHVVHDILIDVGSESFDLRDFTEMLAESVVKFSLHCGEGRLSVAQSVTESLLFPSFPLPRISCRTLPDLRSVILSIFAASEDPSKKATATQCVGDGIPNPSGVSGSLRRPFDLPFKCGISEPGQGTAIREIFLDLFD